MLPSPIDIHAAANFVRADTNVDGQLDTLLEVRDFLDGAARIETNIDTRAQPIVWTVLPEISNVDSNTR